MLRFAALNESDSGEEECDQEDEPITTKEAEEAEAFAAYNRALGLQRAGDGEGAEHVFSSLLNHPFLLKARKLLEADRGDNHHPAFPLLYLVHKNMAASAVAKGNLVHAMKSYLEAVKIDSSEVTVWYKMGSVAKQLHNYPLAKLAFEQGLQCSERHWPSLDAVITVLYALNDYSMCLEYCGRGLERDPYYTKGLVFTRQILKEQPSLTSHTKELFAYCDPIIHTVAVDPVQAEKMIQDCIDIRDKRREMARKPDPPPLTLPTPISQLTWRCVGECLVELFEEFTSCDSPKSLVLPLDMKEYVAMAEGRADHPQHPPSPTPTPTPHTTTTTTTVSTVAASQAGSDAPQRMDVDAVTTTTTPTTTTETSAQPPPSTTPITAVPATPDSGATRIPGGGERQGEKPMEVEEGGGIGGKEKRSSVTMTTRMEKVEVTNVATAPMKSGELSSGERSSVNVVFGSVEEKLTMDETKGGEKRGVEGEAATDTGSVTSSKMVGESSMAEMTLVAKAATSSPPPPSLSGQKKDVVPAGDGSARVLPAPPADLTAGGKQTSSPVQDADNPTALAASAVAGRSSGSTPQTASVSPSSGHAPQTMSVQSNLGPAPQASSVSPSSGHAPQAMSVQSNLGPAPQASSVSPSSGPASQASSVSPSSGPAPVPATLSSSSARVETSDARQTPVEVSAPVKGSSSTSSCESVTSTSISTSSRESGVIVATSSTSVMSQSSAVPVKDFASVVDGRQAEQAVPMTSSTATTVSVSASSEGKERREVLTSQHASQQLTVDVALAAGTGTAVRTSVSVTSVPQLPAVGVRGGGNSAAAALAVGVAEGKSAVGGCEVTSVSSVSSSLLLTPVTCTTPTITPTPTTQPTAAQAPSRSSPSGKAASSTPPPPSQSRAAHSPSLPKFQFNTITPGEVTALLQDCVPSTALLSTPAPSSYSSSLVERFKQTAATAVTTTTSSSSSLPLSSSAVSASAQLRSLAKSSSSSGAAVVSTATVSAPTPPGGERVASGTVVPPVAASDGEKKTAAEAAAVSVSPSNQQNAVQVSTPVSAEVALQDHVGLGRGSRGNRRGTKRKRAPVESRVTGTEHYGVKRRSARVRNTRKEEENVDFQKLLHNFLPSSLTQPVQEEEDSQVEESMSTCQVTSDVTSAELCGGPPLEESETEDVRKYLKECLKRQGVVGMMYKYLAHLSSRDNRVWPAGVTDLYLQVYERARDHLTFPSLYYMDFPEVCYTELSKMALVWSELMLDSFLVKRADTVVSPVSAQREAGPSESGLFSGPSCEEDLHFLSRMVESGFVDLWGDQQIQFTARVQWMRGRLAIADNQMDKALDNLDWVGECLREGSGVTKVYLPNCRRDKVISLEEVKRQQESLKRCQSLEESQRLFEEGHYSQVIDSLSATCVLPQATHQIFKPALPERQAQLELLQDALYQQEDWGRCLMWGEVVLHEALHHYRRAPTLPARDTWAKTIIHLLEGLQRVLDREANAMQLLGMRSLMRLTQNLIRIIEVNHDVSENVTEMPISSVLPWMLLYRIIRQEEDKVQAVKTTATTQEGDEEGSSSSSPITTLPASLMLLSVAHEYLGRNAWCTRESGIFLLFCMDVLTSELPRAQRSVRGNLDTAFEQCVLCLYSHPNRKGRARHLVDHNAPCIELMWEHCEAVFEYFKPKTLPEFDSYKTSTVSAELHNLLRRIYALIPDTDDISPRLNQVHSYVEGNTSTPPNFSCSSIILQELYYLLADYYFKNKEQTKAIRFYTYDVCFNSSRFDSWAGLALAKMYQLEQKLNSMELKIDAPVHKKSIQALRCFSRAVEVDEGCRKLWIEYGSLAYQLHSHASRQLRMKLWFPLTPDLMEIAMETRVEMLATARNCYWKASECEAEGREEEWLHHYMMGKVREKQRQHPRLYLEHYKQAAIYLHEEEAKYPRKILYHSTPPYLSLEALEMYYRLHVAVMKHLLRVTTPETKEDMTLFDRYLTEATESPFALRREKHYDTQDSVSSAEDSQGWEGNALPYSTAHQRPVYHMTPQDHNYSKQKSSGGDTSDASGCEAKDTTTGTETDGSQSSQEETDGGSGKDGGGGLTSSGAETDTREKRASTDMVELHAETDSQVATPLPDTKPLFYDKQVSGGFNPHLDKHLSLVGSSPFPYPSSTTTTITTTTSTTPAVAPSAGDGSKKEGTESGETLREEKPPILLTDKGKRETGLREGGGARGKEVREQTEGRVTPAAPGSRRTTMALTPTPEVPPRAGQQKDVNTSLSSDSSIIIVSCSDEPSEDGREESQVSVKPAAPGGRVPSHDNALTQSSPNKRPPVGERLQPSKRARLTAGDDLERVSAGQSAENDNEKRGQEGDPGLKASLPSQAGAVQELSAMTPEEGMEVDGGGEAAEKPGQGQEGSCPPPSAPRHPPHSQAARMPHDSRTEQRLKSEATDSAAPTQGEKVGEQPEGKAGGIEVRTQPTEDMDLKEADLSASEHADRGLVLAAHSDPSSEKLPHTAPTQPPAGTDGKDRSSAPSTQFQVKQEALSQSVGKDPKASTSERSEVPASKKSSPAVQEGGTGAAQGSEEQSTSTADRPEQKPSVSESQAEQKPLANSAEQNTSTTLSEQEKTAAALEQKPAGLAPAQRSPTPAEHRTSATAASEQPSSALQAGQKESSTNGQASQKESSTNSQNSQKESSTNGQNSQKESSTNGQNSQKESSTNSQNLTDDSGQPLVVLEEGEYREWKKRLLDKCVDGLHLCLFRFPTHYKSLYRLAYLYYASDSHRNLHCARDLLLGNSDWLNLKHMPANGLFSDRKTNNFFNGMWKIPIDEMDRSGSFASHVNRSVQLLLEVLRDLGDVHSLLQVHSQLRKKPLDQGRKYLRDGERHILAQMAHSYTLDAVTAKLCRPLAEVDSTELLLSAFKAYNSHKSSGETQRAMKLLIAAYHRLGLPKHGYSTPLEQAMQYCNKIITSQALTQRSRQLSQSSASNPSTFPTSTPTPSTSQPPAPSSHTVDTGTGPMPLPPHITSTHPPRPSFTHSIGVGPHGGAASGRGVGGPAPLAHPQPFTPSSTLHSSSTTPFRPAHHARPRTLSESSGDVMGSRPLAHHAGASRQQATSAALDPSPPSYRTSMTKMKMSSARPSYHTPPSTTQRKGEVEVIDLTATPEKSGPSGSGVAMTSPPSRVRVGGGGVGGWSHSGVSSRRSPLQQHQDGAGRARGPPPMAGLQSSPGSGPPRGPGGPRSVGNNPRAAFSHTHPAPSTPPHPLAPQPTPFSSPLNFSSAPSTPTTPRHLNSTTADEASDRDLDLTSEQEDELALTSPDKLTSDVRHHFHRDLL